ncbi:DNA-protecting protein DprA [bacterium]|jgi:DNA processing protein|nr:DNA-protecting protein DprA [bacterium]
MLNRSVVLALNAIFFDSPRALHSALQHIHTPSDITDLMKTPFFTKTQRHRFSCFMEADTLSKCAASGIGMVFLGEIDYPRLLSELTDPPPVLFYKGDIKTVSGPLLGVVGPRRASAYGRQVCEQFCRTLAQEFTIVSGLALGIDTIAHRSALTAQKNTLAVLANGLDQVYPTSNQGIATSISRSGCLISEFPPGVPALKHHFPQRNRIVAGLCHGVFVIEASERSGALITARFAVESNREVFAVPGNVLHAASIGVHRLIQDGATLVHSPQDIIDCFEDSHSQQLSLTLPMSTRPSCPANHLPILTLIQSGLSDIDSLISHSGMPPSTVMISVTQLELLGLVHSENGCLSAVH